MTGSVEYKLAQGRNKDINIEQKLLSYNQKAKIHMISLPETEHKYLFMIY
jgi:hypothetical protein